MTTKPTIVAVGALFAGLFVVNFLGSAEPPVKIQDETIAAVQDDVDVRYARACLELARVELRLVEDANKKFHRTFSLPELERKKANVRAAERYLYVVQKRPQGGSIVDETFLGQAREDAKLARREYHRALETKNRDLVYNELKLEKLRLTAEVAQLRLEIWDNPGNLLSLIDHLNWQVERLSHDVCELQKKVEELSGL